ncbi:MAG: family 16 glycosylhydrolase [Flavobacterium sp.]
MKRLLSLYILIATYYSHAQVDVVYNNLVWSDEFNTNGVVNTNNWHHQTQIPAGGNWYNGEVQHYTNELTNSYIENGVLKITAKKESYTSQGYTKQYTSARLNSKFAFTYGRVDIRAKVPTSQGTWPALWLLGKNITEPGSFFTATHGTTSWPACGEIDIMEHGITPSQPTGYVQSAIHTPSSFGNTINHGGTIANNLGNNFHVYSMNWSPFQITFLLDGVAFYTYNPTVKNASTWPFTADQYLLLNIAMGGVAGTIPSNFTQATMEIDYVRVYQNTLQDTQAPFNFTATIGTVTSSTVEILVNGQDNSGSVFYNVAYGSQNIQTASPSGVQKSIIIPNLNPNTSYTFNVTASDISGNNAVNNPIVLNATTTLVIGCSGTSNLAQQGNFTSGYQYNYETLGNNVKVTYTLLDTDKVGVVAYLWRQSPFQETQMTQVVGNTFSHTISNLIQGQNITYGVKFAFSGGLSVTNYYTYQVGNNCNLNLIDNPQLFDFHLVNPVKDVLNFTSSEKIDSIEIYDLMGKLVLKAYPNDNPIAVDYLSKGIYSINVFSGEKKLIKKLIIE